VRQNQCFNSDPDLVPTFFTDIDPDLDSDPTLKLVLVNNFQILSVRVIGPAQNFLKVPSCEIFDYFDFRYFYNQKAFEPVCLVPKKVFFNVC
jgi:hypothetical protein